MDLAFMDNVASGNLNRYGLINCQTDILQCFATKEGNIALRKQTGSPFIRELCLFLEERVKTSLNTVESINETQEKFSCVTNSI